MTRAPDHVTASSAGQYNYWLGRSDHTAADRAAANAVTDYMPTAAIAAEANHHFARNAAWQIAGDHGIAQIIDIGTGIPAKPAATAPNIHEHVHRRDHHTKVAYVDTDPAVLALAHARLIGKPGIGPVHRWRIHHDYTPYCHLPDTAISLYCGLAQKPRRQGE